MEMTLQWYFSVGILGFCAVAMAMRLGARARRRTHHRTASRGSNRWVQWLAARFSRRANDWYCFFHLPDLTGKKRPAPPRPDNRRRTASRSRLRAAAPPRP